MNKEIAQVKEDDAINFTDDFWDFIESVPQGNSDAQIRDFVFKHCKDGRKYRQVVLELKKDAIAVKQENVNRRKEQAEIKKKKSEIIVKREEMKRKLEEEKMTQAEKDARAEVLEAEEEVLKAEIEELEVNLRNRDGLVKDAMQRIKIYLEELGKIGKYYTREEFELEEREYWIHKLLDDAQIECLQHGSVSKGTLESLKRLGMAPDQVVHNAKQMVDRNTRALQRASEDGTVPNVASMALSFEAGQKMLKEKNGDKV